MLQYIQTYLTVYGAGLFLPLLGRIFTGTGEILCCSFPMILPKQICTTHRSGYTIWIHYMDTLYGYTIWLRFEEGSLMCTQVPTAKMVTFSRQACCYVSTRRDGSVKPATPNRQALTRLIYRPQSGPPCLLDSIGAI